MKIVSAVYLLGMWVYGLCVRLASLFNEKARLLCAGRSETWRKLSGFNNQGGTIWVHAASLRGLMDTDGTVSKGRVTWAQKSPRLTSDVCALLCSLGVKCHVRTMKKSIRSSGFVGEYSEIGFCTDLQVFRLERKRSKQTPTRRIDCHWRYIRRIEPIPTVESYCIQVDHPSHTFLAGRQYCVTHNTETLINMLGWIVEYDRANTLLIMDTKTSGIALSKNRIRPFLRDVCGLDYSKTASSKGKDNDHSMNAVDLGIGRGANVKIGSKPSRFRSMQAPRMARVCICVMQG